jgi:hypothetical protein
MARSSRLVVSLPSLLVITLLAMALLAMATGCGSGGAQPPPPTPTPTPAATPSPTPVGANTVAVAFAAPTPVLVAEKVGAGNWTVMPVPNGVPLMVQLPAGTTQYGIAMLCVAAQGGLQVNTEWILEADMKDATSYTLRLCEPASPPATGSFAGSVDDSAIAGAATVSVNLSNFSIGAGFNSPGGSFNVTAPIGTTDVFATAFDAAHTMLAMKVVRGQTVPGVANGGNPITLAASDAVTIEPITVAPLPAGVTSPLMVPFPSYVTGNGSNAVGMNGFPMAQQYAAMAAASGQPGDFYLFKLLASIANGQVFTQQLLKTAAPVTLTLPAPWVATPPSPAKFPTLLFDYTGFAGQPAIADQAEIGWMQGTNANGIIVVTTANFQNGANTVTIPDLTAVPGFLQMAPAGTAITWQSETWGGTTQFYFGSTVVPQTVSTVHQQGTYTQP